MADKKLSQEEMSELLGKITNNVDETSIAFLEDYKKGLIDFNTLIKGLSKVYKAEGEVIREKIRQEKEILLVQKARKEYIKKIAENELKQSQSFWQRTTNFLSGQNSSEDAYQRMWRVRQRFGGLEQMFGGNVASGLSQFLGSFQSVSKIMGGPYYLAIQAAITGLLKFDDALAKVTKTSIALTGGLQSNFSNMGYFGRGGQSLTFLSGLRSPLYKIGMQSEFENITNALTSGYGLAAYQGRQKDFIETMGYAQKGLSSYGISADSSNKLLENLRLLEGKDQQGIFAQLNRLTNRFNQMSMLSPEQALQQATSLYDQTKHLGTNFEWASRMVARFERGLKDGTLALSDFAAINRSMRSGNISQNVGLAAMISDYATRTGISLPSTFTNSNIIGQSFAISTRAMLSNNQFARAYQGQLQEQLDQMGMTTRDERAGALQLLLQSRGINISPEAALSAIKNNGSIDLIGSGIIGTKSFERQRIEQEQSKTYKENTEKYYTASTSWHRDVLTALGNIANNTKGAFGRGLSGDVSSEGFHPVEYAGVFAQALFTQEYWDNFSKMIAKINPGTQVANWTVENATKIVPK